MGKKEAIRFGETLSLSDSPFDFMDLCPRIGREYAIAFNHIYTYIYAISIYIYTCNENTISKLT